MKKKNNSKEVVNSLIPPDDSFIVEKSGKEFGILQNIKYGFNIIHQRIKLLNNSKIFAGLIVIILNIAGRFVNIKLSKTMESYLKHTFSRNILVFCIAWMGSRDIYSALFMTTIFIILMDFVFNEESNYCMLPETFKTYHMSILEENNPTTDEIQNAENVLKRANKSNVDNKDNKNIYLNEYEKSNISTNLISIDEIGKYIN